MKKLLAAASALAVIASTSAIAEADRPLSPHIEREAQESIAAGTEARSSLEPFPALAQISPKVAFVSIVLFGGVILLWRFRRLRRTLAAAAQRTGQATARAMAAPARAVGRWTSRLALSGALLFGGIGAVSLLLGEPSTLFLVGGGALAAISATLHRRASAPI